MPASGGGVDDGTWLSGRYHSDAHLLQLAALRHVS